MTIHILTYWLYNYIYIYHCHYVPLIWKKDCLRTFIWEVWWNRDVSGAISRQLIPCKNSSTKYELGHQSGHNCRDKHVTFSFDTKFLYLVPNTSKYLEIHSKGGPEVRPHPHAAVRMCIFSYQDTSELLRLNQHTDIKIQSQSMSLWLRRKALGATSLKAGEETRRNQKGRGKEHEKNVIKHEKTLEKCQISLASELDLDPPELPAIGSGSVSRITSRPQTQQTWSLRLSLDTGLPVYFLTSPCFILLTKFVQCF